jgi:hypothetical protein
MRATAGQGSFGVATTDRTTHIPYSGSNPASFWVDVQVTGTAPSGASYRGWPALPQPLGWFQDSGLNFTIATEVKLAQSGTPDRIWFSSLPPFPAGHGPLRHGAAPRHTG